MNRGIESVSLQNGVESWPLKKIPILIDRSNAGEVIDKSHWGQGSELLFTCARDPLTSSFEGFPESKRTTCRDLLLTRNGTPYIHQPPPGAIYSNVVQRITLKKGVDRNFVRYALENAASQLKGYGVSIESLNFSMWSNLNFHLPPIEVQKAQSVGIDRETARIDALIEKKTRFIELLKEKRQALITQAVTKGLDPNVPMRDSGVEWIGEVPEHWKIIPSCYLFSNSKVRSKSGDELLSATQKYGVIPKSQFEELEGRQVVHVEKNLELRKHVEIDDFVISMRSFQGGLERAKAVGCVRSSYVVLKRASVVNPDFFELALKSDMYIQGLQSTSNFIRDGQDLTFDDFKQIALPLPPPSEQASIARSVLRQRNLMDELASKCESSISLLRERRSALITAAVTGQIDLREAV